MSVLAFTSLSNSIQSDIIDCPQRPWSFQQKVKWLKELEGRLQVVKVAGETVLKEVRERLEKCSWLDAGWWVYKITYGLCGCGSEETTSVKVSMAMLGEKVAQLYEAFAKEIPEAVRESSEVVIAASNLVLIHRPEDAQVIEAVATRFLKEGAYQETEQLLRDALQKCKGSNKLRSLLIDALLKLQKFEEAASKIDALKVALTPEELSKLADELELKRIESLEGRKLYREAAKALFDLLQRYPEQSAFKQRIMEVHVKQELKVLKESGILTAAQKARFLEGPKKMYGQLPPYERSKWGVDTHVSELDFWLWLLATQADVVNTPHLFEQVQILLYEFIRYQVLPAATVLERFESFIQVFSKQQADFSRDFKALANEIAQQDGEKNEALLAARVHRLMERMNGSENRIGLGKARAISEKFLAALREDPAFQERALQTKVATLEATLDSDRSEARVAGTLVRRLRAVNGEACLMAPAQLLALSDK